MTFEKESAATAEQTVCCCSKESDFIPRNDFDEEEVKAAVLLHSCCGPCSTAVVEKLVEEFNVTVFFYNPCITDEEEYQRRREAQIKFINKFNEEHMGKNRVMFKEGDYRPGSYFELVKGKENDPEGGSRCTLCFKQRLEKAAETAKLSGYDFFGTTLTVSPHKNYSLISDIGRNLALKYGVSFLDRDFKKKNGFGRSVELSKKYDLYRQNYCGCEYSKRGED